LFRFWPRGKLTEDDAVVFNSVEHFHLNGNLFLIRVLQVFRQTHQVHQLLVSSDLNTKAFGFQARNLKIVKLLFFNGNVIDGFSRVAFFLVTGIE
jgi:hypothetical protein